MNWVETATALLDGLFGTDEEPDQCQIECASKESAPEWISGEVRAAIMSMKNKKAPGKDFIEVEMLKVASKTALLEKMTGLYNACLRLGVFPDEWKGGIVRTLIKGNDKDLTATKSYRPICLLPVLSEVLEKLIKSRLHVQIMHPMYMSTQQFSYRTRRSTEDAICELRRIVKDTNKSMVLAPLFDITGAFTKDESMLILVLRYLYIGIKDVVIFC